LFWKYKTNYILQQIFSYLKENVSLEIIKYNKCIQKRLNKNINDYKDYKKIIIEIIPIYKEEFENDFINISEEEPYYYIYFNDEEKEIKKNRLYFDDKVSKIKIIIDEEIETFKGLFEYCDCIEKMNFIKFNRKDINNMSNMFHKCKSLKELNLNNFNTNNVTDMSNMFYRCSSLIGLNLNNFNTSNVTDMSSMFRGCYSLKKLNLNNFDTKNVTIKILSEYKVSII